MRGDILLYEAVKGQPLDWLIAHFTHGKFAHVEVDMGGGLMVSEHFTGITVSPLDTKRAHTSVPVSEGSVDAGMAWIAARVAEAKLNHALHTYGFLDIVSEAIHVLGSALVISFPGHWDCSDFVTRYLVARGSEAPLGDQADDPAHVSPNDLARAFKIPT